MTQDPYAMSQEIVELQTRVAELSVALERVTEQRDNALDAAQSLHKELETTRIYLQEARANVSRLRVHAQSLHEELGTTRIYLQEAHANVSRLRVHIAQGVEL